MNVDEDKRTLDDLERISRMLRYVILMPPLSTV